MTVSFFSSTRTMLSTIASNTHERLFLPLEVSMCDSATSGGTVHLLKFAIPNRRNYISILNHDHGILRDAEKCARL